MRERQILRLPDAHAAPAKTLTFGDRWRQLRARSGRDRPGCAGHGGEHSAGLRMVGRRLVVDWSVLVGRFGHNDVSAIFVCGLAGKQPSCVGPRVFAQAEEVDRCGKDPDCTIRNVYSVRFSCQIDLRRRRAHPRSREIEMVEGIDFELPRPDISDALPIAGKHTLVLTTIPLSMPG